MEIMALFVKNTKEILYNRHRHDYRTSKDGKVSIDGFIDYCRIIGNKDDYIELKLNGDVLLEQILYYDYRFGNNNAKNFPEGYYGKFKLYPNSNKTFYKRLILNYNDIKEYFDEKIDMEN